MILLQAVTIVIIATTLLVFQASVAASQKTQLIVFTLGLEKIVMGFIMVHKPSILP